MSFDKLAYKMNEASIMADGVLRDAPPPLKYWERVQLMDLYEDVDECDETPVLIVGTIKRLLFEVDRLNREISRLHGEDPDA